MRKLGLTKYFARDYEVTQFFLTRQLFVYSVYYGVPDVPANIIAMYHRLAW